jgi:gluconokinase
MQWLQKNILCSDKSMEEFLELGFSADPGADDLIFLPYLLGERAPVWNASAKGFFFGLRIEHKQESLIRAALEGVIYCLYSISRPLLEKATVRQVYATGGFARNPNWVQMVADFFNLPVHLTETVENSAWGAAKWGMQTLGLPVPLSGKVARTFTPDSSNHEIYQQHYAKANRLYALLKEEF